MNWLKLAPYIGGAVVLGLLFWGYQHQIGEAEDRGYDRRVAEEQTEQLAAERRAREEDARALEQRNEERANARAIYAARTPAYIGVCIPAPSLPGATEAEPSSEGRTAGTGVLPERDAPSAISYFDVQPLDELAAEADRIVAECRALQNRVGL